MNKDWRGIPFRASLRQKGKFERLWQMGQTQRFLYGCTQETCTGRSGGDTSSKILRKSLISWLAILIILSVMIITGRIYMADQKNNMMVLQYTTRIGRSLFKKKIPADMVTGALPDHRNLCRMGSIGTHSFDAKVEKRTKKRYCLIWVSKSIILCLKANRICLHIRFFSIP